VAPTAGSNRRGVGNLKMLCESEMSDKPKKFREGQVLMKDPESKTESGQSMGISVGLEDNMWNAMFETSVGIRLTSSSRVRARVVQKLVIRCCTPGN
jgi:hypothetical protein